jgi:hypothetical protein
VDHVWLTGHLWKSEYTVCAGWVIVDPLSLFLSIWTWEISDYTCYTCFRTNFFVANIKHCSLWNRHDFNTLLCYKQTIHVDLFYRAILPARESGNTGDCCCFIRDSSSVLWGLCPYKTASAGSQPHSDTSQVRYIPLLARVSHSQSSWCRQLIL